MKRLGIAASVCCVLVLACGSDPVNGSPSPAPSSTMPAPSSSGPDMMPPGVTCDEPDFEDESLPKLSVGQVSVTLHDPSGAPIAGQPTYVCGAYVCGSPSWTDEEGSGGPSLDTPAIKPALKVGDAVAYPELAILIDHPQKGMKFPTITLPPFPTDGAPLAPGTTSSSNGVVVTLAGDATFDTTLTVNGTLDPFRAVELPAGALPEGLDHGAGLERVFALEPLATVVCPPAGLSLPNSAGWDAGTPVEFLVQGLGAVEQPFAPYGDWQSIGTGAVDESGENLVLTSGGLPIIYNVGVRRL
jgi:hypothetical protein